MNKKGIVLMIIGIVLYLSIGIFLYNKKVELDNVYVETREVVKLSKNEEKQNGYLYIYETEEGTICLNNCNDLKQIYKVKVDVDNAYLIKASSSGNYLLVQDSNLKIVDLINEKQEVLNLENKYDYYELNTYTKNDVEVLTSITCFNGENPSKYKVSGLYNVVSKELLYENKYDTLEVIDENYAYVSNETEKKDTLVSILEEREVFSFDRYVTDNLLNVYKTTMEVLYSTNGRTIVKVNSYVNNKVEKVSLYQINGTLIEENIDDVSSYENELYILKNNKLDVFNFNNTFIKSIDLSNYDKVNLIENYLVVHKDNNLYLMLTDNQEEILLKEDITTYDIDKPLSLTKTMVVDEISKTGLFIVVLTSDEKLTIYYDPITKEIEEILL